MQCQDNGAALHLNSEQKFNQVGCCDRLLKNYLFLTFFGLPCIIPAFSSFIIELCDEALVDVSIDSKRECVYQIRIKYLNMLSHQYIFSEI